MDKPQNINKDRKLSRRKPAVDFSAMIYGKIPPQATELEEAVLGAIMLEKGVFDTVAEILKPDCFYTEAHQLIFKACQRLANKSMPIDLLTVAEELKLKDELSIVGGPYFITKLTNSVVSSAHVEAHARIVLQKFIQRELIRISSEIMSESYEDHADVFDLMDTAEDKIFQITNNFLKTDYREMGVALAQTLTRIDELRNKQEAISGVPSGFKQLDKVTYGWQPSDLIILAARPSMGKTAFALNLARNAALHPIKPVPVAFFSLEMSATQLVQRILSAESEIDSQKIARGKLEEYEYQQLHTKGIKHLEQAPLFIDDTAALNIFEFRAKARRLVNKHNVGLIIIDYLQLMSSAQDNRNTNREQEISTISRNLKALAKELNIPIIALSQLSRAVETRKESKMPQLSDLRESGAIEQDADVVMFIYRPEYYEQLTDEHGESLKNKAFIRIAKHRNGMLETIKLNVTLALQKFEDADDNDRNALLPHNTTGGNLFIQKGSRMNDDAFNDNNFNEPIDDF